MVLEFTQFYHFIALFCVKAHLFDTNVLDSVSFMHFMYFKWSILIFFLLLKAHESLHVVYSVNIWCWELRHYVNASLCEDIGWILCVLKTLEAAKIWNVTIEEQNNKILIWNSLKQHLNNTIDIGPGIFVFQFQTCSFGVRTW